MRPRAARTRPTTRHMPTVHGRYARPTAGSTCPAYMPDCQGLTGQPRPPPASPNAACLPGPVRMPPACPGGCECRPVHATPLPIRAARSPPIPPPIPAPLPVSRWSTREYASSPPPRLRAHGHSAPATADHPRHPPSPRASAPPAIAVHHGHPGGSTQAFCPLGLRFAPPRGRQSSKRRRHGSTASLIGAGAVHDFSLACLLVGRLHGGERIRLRGLKQSGSRDDASGRHRRCYRQLPPPEDVASGGPSGTNFEKLDQTFWSVEDPKDPWPHRPPRQHPVHGWESRDKALAAVAGPGAPPLHTALLAPRLRGPTTAARAVSPRPAAGRLAHPFQARDCYRPTRRRLALAPPNNCTSSQSTNHRTAATPAPSTQSRELSRQEASAEAQVNPRPPHRGGDLTTARLSDLPAGSGRRRRIDVLDASRPRRRAQPSPPAAPGQTQLGPARPPHQTRGTLGRSGRLRLELSPPIASAPASAARRLRSPTGALAPPELRSDQRRSHLHPWPRVAYFPPPPSNLVHPPEAQFPAPPPLSSAGRKSWPMVVASNRPPFFVSPHLQGPDHCLPHLPHAVPPAQAWYNTPTCAGGSSARTRCPWQRAQALRRPTRSHHAAPP